VLLISLISFSSLLIKVRIVLFIIFNTIVNLRKKCNILLFQIIIYYISRIKIKPYFFSLQSKKHSFFTNSLIIFFSLNTSLKINVLDPISIIKKRTDRCSICVQLLDFFNAALSYNKWNDLKTIIHEIWLF